MIFDSARIKDKEDAEQYADTLSPELRAWTSRC